MFVPREVERTPAEPAYLAGRIQKAYRPAHRGIAVLLPLLNSET